MNTAEVAKNLVELCRKGDFDGAIESLYANSVVTMEGCEMPGMPRETRGIENVRKKGQWWNENHEVHGCTVTGPFLSMEKFAVVFAIDVTFKPKQQRHQMTEVAVYTVEAGKIVHVEFLFQPPEMK